MSSDLGYMAENGDLRVSPACRGRAYRAWHDRDRAWASASASRYERSGSPVSSTCGAEAFRIFRDGAPRSVHFHADIATSTSAVIASIPSVRVTLGASRRPPRGARPRRGPAPEAGDSRCRRASASSIRPTTAMSASAPRAGAWASSRRRSSACLHQAALSGRPWCRRQGHPVRGWRDLEAHVGRLQVAAAVAAADPFGRPRRYQLRLKPD